MALDELTKRLPRGYMDLGKVMAGTFARNGLRGVFKIFIAGLLAPGAMGILRAVFSFFKLVTSLAELGLDSAMVTFVSAAIKNDDQEEKDRILKTVLAIRAFTVGVLLLTGVVLAPRLAGWVFSDTSLTIYVRMIFVAVGGQLMWRYISSYLSAHQRFSKLAVFLTTVPILMLSAALALAIFGRLTLHAIIVIHLAAPTLTALFWLPALDRGFLRQPLAGNPRAGMILRFSRWIYFSGLASTSRNHLNPLLLKNPYFSGTLAAGEVNAGLYGFGSDLANEVTVFSQSLMTVLLPKASRATTGPELRRFVRRSYRHLLLLLVPAALPLFLARPFLLLLGMMRESYLEYLPSLEVFTILYVGALFSIAGIPMQTALYSMKLPRVETYIEMALLVVLVVGAFVLIPKYGSQGAAFIVLIQRVLFFLVSSAYGWSRLRSYETDTA